MNRITSRMNIEGLLEYESYGMNPCEQIKFNRDQSNFRQIMHDNVLILLNRQWNNLCRIKQPCSQHMFGLTEYPDRKADV